MSTITLAKSRCVNATCPSVHVHEDSGSGYVVGVVTEIAPQGARATEDEAIVVLPADVTATAAAARPLPGLVPFASWPGVLIDQESGVGYVVGLRALAPPVGVAAGPGEAIVAVPRVFGKA